MKSPEPRPSLKELEDAYFLYLDGAFRRKSGVAAAGIVVFHPDKSKFLEKGEQLGGVLSNNEAKYAALALGLRTCLEQGVKRLNVFGDSMLLIRQIQGTWQCKSSSLSTRLREVRGLMRAFEAIQISHVPRSANQEADKLADPLNRHGICFQHLPFSFYIFKANYAHGSLPWPFWKGGNLCNFLWRSGGTQNL